MPQKPIKIYLFLGIILCIAVLLILFWLLQSIFIKPAQTPKLNNTFTVPVVVNGTPTPTLIPGL